MKIKYEDIDRVINILQKSKEQLKPGEVFEFTNNKLKIKKSIPTSWCIKANTQEELDIIYKYICTEEGESKDIEWYYHYPHLEGEKGCYAHDKPEKGFIVITFKEFLEIMVPF